MELLEPARALWSFDRTEDVMDSSIKDMVSQPPEWIPFVDWFAGLTGALVIAALLWAAIAIA
jgi:hypothetical protein